jgi:hypothetical protein
MWGNRYQTDEQIRRENRRLQDELDAQRYEREREQERREHEQERRQREFRQEMQERARSAADWPEAFRKNRVLMERERNECYAADDETPEYRKSMNELRAGWTRYLSEIDCAAALWREEQRAIDEAIREIRLKVADKLQAEFPNSELADYIREDAIDEWMSW